MNTTEIKQHISFLNDAYSDYRQATNNDKKWIISGRVRGYITNNYELYILATGGVNVGDYGRALSWDDSFKPDFFTSDISSLLNELEQIKEK